MTDTNTKKGPKHWIKSTLFFLLAALLLAYILVEAFAPSQTVRIFGFKPYVVLTQSMEPKINVDDVVIVKRPNTESLEVGDIITFSVDINNDGNDEVVTHYVYSLEYDSSMALTIKTHPHFENPDNITPDRWELSEDNLLGEHILTVPYIGLVIRFLQSPFGIAALAVNAAIVVGIIYLLKRDNPATSEKEK
jgi:signal peptidase